MRSFHAELEHYHPNSCHEALYAASPFSTDLAFDSSMGSLNLSYVKTVFALALELQSHNVATAQCYFFFELYCLLCCLSIFMHVMSFVRIATTAYLPAFRASAS